MKKFVAVLLAAMMLLTTLTAIAEEENNMNWAYGAMPLNNGNVSTIYYTAAYYELEGMRTLNQSMINDFDPENVAQLATYVSTLAAIHGIDFIRRID